MNERLAALAELCSALAAALAEPVPGLPQGDPLPALRAAARRAQPYLPPAAADAPARLPDRLPADLLARRRRLPVTWYQSLAHGERLLGPTADRLRALYARAGLTLAVEELPDHAAVEVAFLAWLCAAQAAADTPAEAGRLARLRRTFLQQHALTWLPTLAQGLQAGGDPYHAALGRLLAAVLQALHPSPRRGPRPAWQPALVRPEDCVLCGFCRQTCPRGALRIQEDARQTRLVLYPAVCTACERCLRVCPTQALQPGPRTPQAVLLRRSPRAHCPRCGRPTVSQAELAWVRRRLQATASEAVLTRIAWCVSCK